MKKENIYVVIDSEEKRLRALQILSDAGEFIHEKLNKHHGDFLKFADESWFMTFNGFISGLNEITLDQLEQLLTPNYTVKEVHLTLDELKAKAESLGYELVKKERKPKVGDFGVFWGGCNSYKYMDFLAKIDVEYYDHDNTGFENFRFLTEEEKQNIQNNW